MSTHANMVKMTVSSVGADPYTITLNAASSGFQSFADAYGANATVDILITQGTVWEVARNCTYTHSGTTVTRGTLEDSSTGSRITTFDNTAVVSVVATAAFGNNLEKQLNRGIVNVTNDGSTAQSLTAGGWRKINTALTTVSSDPYSWWDTTNKKFLPTRAGVYFLTAFVQQANGTAATNTCALYKDGVIAITGPSAYSPSYSGALATGIMSFNGSSTYAEVYLYPGAVTADTHVGAEAVYFNAFYLGE